MEQVGITIASQKYDLNASTPFQPSDILDLRPVVKHSVPVCSEAKVLVEAGKAQLAEVGNIVMLICRTTFPGKVLGYYGIEDV